MINPAAARIPCRSSTGLTPEVTRRIPWFTISWVRRVEVVVPSPALCQNKERKDANVKGKAVRVLVRFSVFAGFCLHEKSACITLCGFTTCRPYPTKTHFSGTSDTSAVCLRWMIPYTCSTGGTANPAPEFTPARVDEAIYRRRPPSVSHSAELLALLGRTQRTHRLSDFCATSCTSLTPTFCSWSPSEISLAMVTPSFTISGAPYARSNTTFRPFGPRVTWLASRQQVSRPGGCINYKMWRMLLCDGLHPAPSLSVHFRQNAERFTNSVCTNTCTRKRDS